MIISAGHLRVDMASPEALQACLPDGPVYVASPWEDTSGEDDFYGRRDTYHPLGQWTLSSSADNPAILYDDGASTCSPVITIDRAGNALHFHEAFGLFDRTDLYYDALPERVAIDGTVTAITGTNKWLSEEGQQEPNYLDRIVNSVEDRVRRSHPSVTFLPLLSRRYPTQHRAHPIVPPDTAPCGFVFIPQYLSSDKQNHLLVIPNESRFTIDGIVRSRS